MGVSMIPGLFLARNVRHVSGAKRGLILGRQKLHLPPPRRPHFLFQLAMLGFRLREADILQADGFTETLLGNLGYPKIEAMDFTDFEGAEHVHDLNLPCPAHLQGQFDLVIDGWTTEHIFHIGAALDTCHQLLAPGGVFMSYVACDGWFGHGFFQTGPDVPWRYWHHARGYEMLEVSIVARKNPTQVISIPDPTGQRRGGERALEGPHMITYACRRPLIDPPYGPPIQGHYVKGPYLKS